MTVNMNNTKVMMSGERQQKAARWPCGVSGNSIQCTNCQNWHKRSV